MEAAAEVVAQWRGAIEVFQPAADRTAPPPAPPADLIDRMINAGPRYGIEFLEMLPTPGSGASTAPRVDVPNGTAGLQH